MLRLVLGTAGTGKTAMITREISQKALEGEGSLCLIVPEQYSYEAERELCAVCGDGISLSAEVLSFSRLSLRVAQELGTGGRSYVDGGGRLLCMNLALREMGHSLSVYSAAARDSRLQQELLSAVEEFRTAGVTSDDLLSAAGDSSGQLSAKLKDLSLVMEAYEAVLANGRADSVHRLQRLAETIAESSLGQNGQFYIDGFTDFTAAELAVIRAIMKCGAPLTVCLTCDGLFSDSEHFRPAVAAANAVKRMAEELNTEVEILSSEPETAEDASPVRFLAGHLFLHTPEKREITDGSVRIFRAPDIYAECELAAARALELVRETGCRYGDIAIAARGFSDYLAPLEDVFRLYGVPLFTAGRGSVLQKPVPAFIESAFRVIQGGWDTEDVLAYIKTGLTGLTQEETDVLCSYAVLWGIKGSMWYRPEPWKLHPGGFGQAETEQSAELLSRIDSLRRSLAKPLQKLSQNGKAAQTASEQVKVFTDFLEEIALPLTLERHAEALDKAGLNRQADEFVQLWGLVCRTIGQTVDILGSRPITQDEFSKLFLLTLSSYDVSSIPFSADTVSAGELDRMRRRHIRHLIILGASDDRIPMPSENGVLLSDEDRDALSALGINLGGRDDSLARELSLIYNCVSLPSDTLTVCYAASDLNGAACRPSLLISRAEMLFDIPVETVNAEKLKLSALGPAFLLAAGSDEAGPCGAVARAYFSRTEAGRTHLEQVWKRAEDELGSLSSGAVKSLYGSEISISPSRADVFFSCPFQYFLRYGLRLNEKEQAGFEAPELGEYMHFVLENCAREISGSVGFENADSALTSSLADKYTDIYIERKLGGFQDKSARFVFLFNRLRDSVKRVVSDMVRELARSDFRPLDFELAFSGDGQLPPIHLSDGENSLYIEGIADRIDGFFKDGKLYIRVIDYKTGRKSFSLSDVWYSMGMQMLLYLFSLESTGKARYEGEIVPAGVLYVPARDLVVSAPGDLTDSELAAERSKALRRSGLLLSDPTVLNAMEHGDSPEYIPVKYKDGTPVQTDSLANSEMLEKLRVHVEGRLLELSGDISRGMIEALPGWKGPQDNACVYCPYKRVCRFDGSKDSCRSLETVSAAEFWSRLEGTQHE